jgi:hypothetical protein
LEGRQTLQEIGRAFGKELLRVNFKKVLRRPIETTAEIGKVAAITDVSDFATNQELPAAAGADC